MIDSKISCVLTEPILTIFSGNTSGWLQLKYWRDRIFSNRQLGIRVYIRIIMMMMVLEQ